MMNECTTTTTTTRNTLLKQLIRLYLQSSVMKATYTRSCASFCQNWRARHQDNHICCFCSCSSTAICGCLSATCLETIIQYRIDDSSIHGVEYHTSLLNTATTAPEKELAVARTALCAKLSTGRQGIMYVCKTCVIYPKNNFDTQIMIKCH